MRKLTRRQFVKAGAATAGAAAGAILLGPTLNLGSLVQGEKRASAATAQWVASGCNGCVGWCPLRVKVVDGKAVKIAGNPNSKWTRGKLCPRGRLNLQILYDPDRVKKPLKRTNPQKGRDQDPGWVEISWEEAIATIAGKLKDLRDKGMPERFALFRGRYTPLDADILYSRFAKAYGTPNAISHSAICDETNKSGNWYARGKYSYSAPDLEDANYILAFGTPFLESHRPTTGVLAAWPEGRRGRAIRPKTVVVDPRYSMTASRADEWIPINPGTDGALALGMAHHILTLGLWDRKFVGDFVDTAKKFVGGEAVA
ncbi:MAG: molybdopterin-dependent oxidoreductase, partial [Chloroflexota bacterium]